MRRRMGVVLATCVLLGFAAPADARQVVVHSFDGTPIVAHFFPAAGLKEGHRAPTLLMGPGWGSDGETDRHGGTIGPYIHHGFNVLTWDPRGFGKSGGTVEIDSPKYEGRDVSALIDYVARQREARLDGPGDPLVGMNGPSYGGGIQLVAAAIDHRIDAIAPTIAWHNLPSSLFPRGAIKAGWDLILVGIGVPTSTVEGVLSPAGIQTGNQSPQFYDSTINGLATGQIPPDDARWFAEHGPGFLLDRVHIPTLIVQGTVDTLFTLDQGARNYAALRHNGAPLKMMWYCGGHGACLTENDSNGEESLVGEGGLVFKRKLAWFDRYLKGRRVATGPGFEWIDENGDWHHAPRYPVPTPQHVYGHGSGQLPLEPGENPGSGVLIFATPTENSVQVPIDAPRAGSRVLGPPRLKLTYSATGESQNLESTYVYAQLVDEDRNVVVNNQATPIPIKLDGQTHQLSLPMVRVASLSGDSGYTLQITPQTSVYDLQRATGVVDFDSIRVSLPIAGAG